MRRSVFLAAALLVGACVAGSSPTSTTEQSLPTTSTSIIGVAPTTTAVPPAAPTPVPFAEEPDGWPVGVDDLVRDSILDVDGACVTAVTDGGVYLLVWPASLARHATIEEDRVVMAAGGWVSGSVRSLVTGERYHLRGVVDDPGVEPVIAEGVCEFDSTLILAGAVPASDSDQVEDFPTYGSVFDFTQSGLPQLGWPVEIDGVCVTLDYGHDFGKSLIVWPTGSVSSLPDGSIHYSLWEYGIDSIIREGDFVTARLYSTPELEGMWIVEPPPPECEYEALAYINFTRIHTPNPAEILELPDRLDFDGIEASLYRGPEHCGWHPTFMMFVRSDTLNGPFTPTSSVHVFIRDPSVIPENTYAADIDLHRQPPADAGLVGTPTEGYELWYSHSDPYYIYLRSGNQTEAWVRAVRYALCA